MGKYEINSANLMPRYSPNKDQTNKEPNFEDEYLFSIFWNKSLY